MQRNEDEMKTVELSKRGPSIQYYTPRASHLEVLPPIINNCLVRYFSIDIALRALFPRTVEPDGCDRITRFRNHLRFHAGEKQ